MQEYKVWDKHTQPKKLCTWLIRHSRDSYSREEVVQPGKRDSVCRMRSAQPLHGAGHAGHLGGADSSYFVLSPWVAGHRAPGWG